MSESRRVLDDEGQSASDATRPSRGIRILYAFLAVGTVLFAAFYVLQLLREDPLGPRFSVDLDPREVAVTEVASAGDGTRPVLRVAIAPVISPEKSIEIYRDLVHYLARRLGRDAVVLPRATYAEINELVRDRRCEVALVCTYAFVRGAQDFGMEALVVPRVQGALSYTSLIVVSATSEAGSLLDLRGSRFAYADMMSSSGWLYPALWLTSHGEDPESFFSDLVETGSHDRSLHAVSSGYADGAAVHSLVYDRMVEEDPSLRVRTRIIQESSPFGMPPFVVHPQMSPDLKLQLLNELLGMHEDPEGREILAAIAIDRFVTVDVAMYDSVRDAAARWESRR